MFRWTSGSSPSDSESLAPRCRGLRKSRTSTTGAERHDAPGGRASKVLVTSAHSLVDKVL